MLRYFASVFIVCVFLSLSSAEEAGDGEMSVCFDGLTGDDKTDTAAYCALDPLESDYAYFMRRLMVLTEQPATKIKLSWEREGPSNYLRLPDENGTGKILWGSYSSDDAVSEDSDNVRVGLYFNLSSRRQMRVLAGADYFFVPSYYPFMNEKPSEQSSSERTDNWGSSVRVSFDF